MKSIMVENRNKKGHYSHAMISNNMLYISGQLPFDYINNKMVEPNIQKQCEQVLFNIEQVLNEVGLTKNNIVQTRVYISDIKYWDAIDSIYEKYFVNHKPARIIVPTLKLHHEALIEIEAIAEMEGK